MSNLVEILHRISNKLTEITEEIQIYQIMNEGVKGILPNAYFLITKLQPDDMNFRIIHSFGFDKYINAIKVLLGKDPFLMDFPFSDLSEAKRKEFESRKLHHFTDGIYDLVNGKINKTICKAIEKILGISDVYAISFAIENKYFGGASFFIPLSTNNSGGLSQDDVFAIESIASQASFSINRLREFKSLKNKEYDLHITNTKFNQLVSQLNDIVWKANGDGTELIDLNNSFENFYGYPSSEFVKNPILWFDIVHPEDKNIAEKANKELFKNGKSECEYRIQRPDGKIIWLHDRKSIVYDLNEKPVQMGGVASDITEKKNLEEQLKLKNYALDNSPSAIGMADFNGVVFYVNNSFVQIWGYDNKTELIGKHFSEFSIKGNPSKEAINTIMEGKIFIGEDESVRKDGSIFSYIVSASMVLHNKKPLCIMAVFVDNTERKQQEIILRDNEAKLLKLNNDKNKFFSIISHDLRSPFNGMLGLLDVIANNYYSYSDEERLKIIQSSLSSAIKVFNLMTDLFEWARLQNNKFENEKETINLNEIIKENIKLFWSDAEKKEILIKNSIVQNIHVTLDVHSFNTVVRNLLINAIKFTPNGGSIEFEIKQIQSDIEFSIKDTGVGMSEETINKLFRLDEKITMPGTNNEQGTGLGLTICNDIVALNGWKMNIESQPGNGTTCRILIPREINVL